MGRRLWREIGPVIYSSWWASSTQTLSGLSPADSWPYFTLSLLRFRPTWRVSFLYVYPKNRATQLHPQAFCCTVMAASNFCIFSARTAQEISRPLFHVASLLGNLSPKLFPSNGCSSVTCLQECYLATDLNVKIHSPPQVLLVSQARNQQQQVVGWY
jgi:hypothetical protein